MQVACRFFFPKRSTLRNVAKRPPSPRVTAPRRFRTPSGLQELSGFASFREHQAYSARLSRQQQQHTLRNVLQAMLLMLRLSAVLHRLHATTAEATGQAGLQPSLKANQFDTQDAKHTPWLRITRKERAALF